MQPLPVSVDNRVGAPTCALSTDARLCMGKPDRVRGSQIISTSRAPISSHKRTRYFLPRYLALQHTWLFFFLLADVLPRLVVLPSKRTINHQSPKRWHPHLTSPPNSTPLLRCLPSLSNPQNMTTSATSGRYFSKSACPSNLRVPNPEKSPDSSSAASSTFRHRGLPYR